MFSSTKSRRRPPSTDSPGPRSSSGRPLGPACCPPCACQRGGSGQTPEARAPTTSPSCEGGCKPSFIFYQKAGVGCSLGLGSGAWELTGRGREALGYLKGASRTCGSRWSSASPQSVPTARAPRKPSRGRNRRGPRSRSRSRERGAGRLSSRIARAL